VLVRTCLCADVKVTGQEFLKDKVNAKIGLAITVHVMMGSGEALDRHFPAGSLCLGYWTTSKNQSSNQYSYSPSSFNCLCSHLLFVFLVFFFLMSEFESRAAG